MFDTEKFITLVESKTCLWKISEKSYTDREKKRKAWYEIGQEMLYEWKNLSEDAKSEKKTMADDYPYGGSLKNRSKHESTSIHAQIIPNSNPVITTIQINPRISIANKNVVPVINLQKKWKNIKDAFLKELKHQKQVKNSTRRRYIYHEFLNFLLPEIQEKSITPKHQHKDENEELKNEIITIKEETIVVEEEEEETQLDDRIKDEIEIDDDKSDETIQSILPKLKRVKRCFFEETLLNILQKHEDEDVCFFNSLMPSVKKLNDQQKIEFRMQVLTALRKVREF